MIRNVLRWPGSKSKVADKLIEKFPKDCKTYIDPMCGGLGLFLSVKQQSLFDNYWINDIDDNLISFWKTCQDEKKCNALVDLLLTLRQNIDSDPRSAKEMFVTYRNLEDLYIQTQSLINPTAPIKALRFFLLNRMSFNGATEAGGFSQYAAEKRFTIRSIEKLRELPKILENTTITNRCVFDFLDAEVFPSELKYHPERQTFIFFDSPYFQASKLYGKNGKLHKFDFERLASYVKCLDYCGYKVMLSYDDCEYIRKLYSWAKFDYLDVQYSMDTDRKLARELVITNYE